MCNIAIAEEFFSIQGEGKLTGTPSLFIRPFGCNLNCIGFGQPDPSDPSTYKKVEFTEENLEISPKYGCDSPKAVQKFFYKYCNTYSVEEYYKYLKTKFKPYMFRNLVITGGEPLLHQDFWIKFFNLIEEDIKNKEYFTEEYQDTDISVTFETNGSISINEELKNSILSLSNFKFLLSVSPKLNCVAGVNENISIKPEILAKYVDWADKNYIDLQLKFVFNGDNRAIKKIFEIKDQIEFLLKKKINSQYIMLMPVGAWEQEKELARKTVSICCENQFLYSGRVHVDIFGKINGV